jgi:tetratricopeptide (TPR) repeat protein
VSFERSSAYDEALKWLDDALAAMPPRAGRVAAEVFAAKSVTLYRKGVYPEAIAWGRRSLAAARRIGEPAVIAYAENMLGSSYQAEGSLREAVRHFSEAVRLYGEIGDASGEAAANNNLGSCLQDLGMLDDARRHYEVARKADERAGDFVDMAIVFNNIGEILLMQGDYAGAAASLERVLEAHREEEELTAVAGLSYVNLCRCAMATGDLEAADRHIHAGMRLLRAVGARGLLTEANLQLAELHVAQGDLKAARRVAERALDDAKRLGDRRMEARGERIAGIVCARGGQPRAAETRLQDSALLARRIGASYEEARALLELARPRVAASPPRARAHLRRAASIFERMGVAPELAEARRLLAAAEAADGGPARRRAKLRGGRQ